MNLRVCMLAYVYDKIHAQRFWGQVVDHRRKGETFRLAFRDHMIQSVQKELAGE